MKTKLLAIPILLLLVALAPVFGQAISGDVTGTVSDPSGALIPGATLTIQNDQTGVKTTTTANTNGVYRFTNLPVGVYTLTSTSQGFAPFTQKGIRVELGNTLTANITMSVGNTATTVEVSEAGAGIDTTTAQLQANFDTKQVMELPQAASGSGIYNLALVGSGVSTSGGVGQGFGPSVSGQRPDNNSFFLDGVSNNNYYNPAPLMYVPNDAIAEFTLLQNQFSPEFGGGSGGIFTAVIKSGTNAIHGSVYEYLQNRKLNAVDSLQATQGLTSNPRFDNNRLGATIGGPIFKNKLFYFGNFEYNPIGQAAVPGAPLYSPTAAGYSLLSSLAGVSKTNLSEFQKYIPAAAKVDPTLDPVTVLGKTIPIGSIAFDNPVYTNNYNALVAIDYNISDKDQLRGRWIYNKQSSIVAATVPAFNASQPFNNYAYNLSEFHNFTPTLQNEFRGSFSRNFNQLPGTAATFPGLDAYPVIQIDELNGINWGPVGPSGSIQNLFQLTNNVTKIMGKHQIKVGGDFIDMIASNFFIQRVTGNYEYNNLETYLTDQSPDVLGERSAGATSYPVGFLQFAGYANDNYRIRPNLTLNIGVRYEYVTVPVASRYQAASAPASTPLLAVGEPKYDKTNFAPRIGFAYAPGKAGAWSIRGGFAQAYNLVYSNLTSNSAPPYFQQTNDCPGPKCPETGFLAKGGLPGTAVPLPKDQAGALAPLASYTFGGKRPYGLVWTMGVQHVFKNNYTVEARYTGTRGVHLWNQTRFNIFSRVNANNFIPTFTTLPSAATLAGLTTTLAKVKSYIVPGGTAAIPQNDLAALGSQSNIVGYAPQATSTYHGLALQLNRRFSNGLSYIGAYTWSHNLDDATATNFSTYLTPRRAQDLQNLKADWSNSALDRRQRFTFTPLYEFRPYKNGNWLMKNVVGNWNISGTYTYESPEFATVQSGLDTNLNGDSAGDRVIVNSTGAANVGTGVSGYNAAGQKVAAGSGAIVAYVANNSNARYIVAQSGAMANSGRNTFPLHPINNIDAALKKRFSFTEHRAFDIGAQFYNVLNHAQYTGGYINDVASRGFTGARNDLVPSDPLFGRFDQFYSSNSRAIQIFAHFTF